MKIIQSRSFERKVGKFVQREKRALDRQIRKIANNPSVGSEKKGDLRGIYVHECKLQSSHYLLAYRFVAGAPELIMIGPQEKYYRDLKSR
jgi:hypothetical protein